MKRNPYLLTTTSVVAILLALGGIAHKATAETALREIVVKG